MRKLLYRFLFFNIIYIGFFSLYTSTKNLLHQKLEEKGYNNAAYVVKNADVITQIINDPTIIPNKICKYAVSQTVDYGIESSKDYIFQGIDYGIETYEYYVADYINTLLGYNDNSNSEFYSLNNNPEFIIGMHI